MGVKNMMGMVPLNPITLDAGRMMDGFQDAIERATRDLADRPGNLNPRMITVSVKFIPDPGAADMAKQGDDLNVPTIEWDVSLRVPKNKGAATRAILMGGMLQVSEASPDDPMQTNIVDLPGVMHGK